MICVILALTTVWTEHTIYTEWGMYATVKEPTKIVKCERADGLVVIKHIGHDGKIKSEAYVSEGIK